MEKTQISVTLTVKDVIDGFVREYGDMHHGIFGVDPVNKMLLSNTDAGEGYGVNSFTLELRNGVLHTIVSDMAQFQFDVIE